MSGKISFSFGKNWSNFIRNIDDQALYLAREDIRNWLNETLINGKSVLDIGCGSGIHSLCFNQMGAKMVASFDYDLHSVNASRFLWERNNRPDNWKILHGSVLDNDFLNSLGKFDIVYTWGVLHHTGNMWKAFDNVLKLIEDEGFFLVAIYVKGPNYNKHLRLKERFNKSNMIEKRIMIFTRILSLMNNRALSGKNPFTWNHRTVRGMSIYYDMIDWLGGLPYEVASKEDVIEYCIQDKTMKLIKITEAFESGCNIYLFQKSKKDRSSIAG